jgi:hypothetical protein
MAASGEAYSSCLRSVVPGLLTPVAGYIVNINSLAFRADVNKAISVATMVMLIMSITVSYLSASILKELYNRASRESSVVTTHQWQDPDEASAQQKTISTGETGGDRASVPLDPVERRRLERLSRRRAMGLTQLMEERLYEIARTTEARKLRRRKGMSLYPASSTSNLAASARDTTTGPDPPGAPSPPASPPASPRVGWGWGYEDALRHILLSSKRRSHALFVLSMMEQGDGFRLKLHRIYASQVYSMMILVVMIIHCMLVFVEAPIPTKPHRRRGAMICGAACILVELLDRAFYQYIYGVYSEKVRPVGY